MSETEPKAPASAGEPGSAPAPEPSRRTGDTSNAPTSQLSGAGMLIFSATLTLWACYQLIGVLVHGEIYSGPYTRAYWVTFAKEPVWFVTAIVVNIGCAILGPYGLWQALRR